MVAQMAYEILVSLCLNVTDEHDIHEPIRVANEGGLWCGLSVYYNTNVHIPTFPSSVTSNDKCHGDSV